MACPPDNGRAPGVGHTMVCPYDNSEPPCGWTVDVLNVVQGHGASGIHAG